MKYLVVLLLIACSHHLHSQTPLLSKKAVVVLTYDDALDQHLTYVVPALDSLRLRGTFYIADYLHHLDSLTPQWKKAAKKGHELGNHTLKHPCAGGVGRSFVQPGNDLNTTTFAELKEDILKLNRILHDIDGKDKRSFAYPCGDQRVHGDTLYIDSLKNLFNSARGVTPAMLSPKNVSVYDVNCYSMAGQSGEEMIALVKEAVQKKAVLVFLFHGVGGGHSLNVSVEAHSQLLHYLKDNERELWIAPMVEVADYIKTF